MNCIIISIGDELVLGQTVDTNSAWLSRQLATVGCGVLAHLTVSDDQKAIEEAIRYAAPKCQVLIVSGGLGPTADDLTRQAIGEVMGQPLELSEAWLAEMQRFFAARGRPMPEQNRIQAMIPRTAKMIWNHNGTAAGIRATIRTGATACELFAVPGVPKEMVLMFERDVLPFVKDRGNGGVILSRTLHTFGLGESSVAERLGQLMERGRNPSVGTTVSGGIVSLRINARFPSRDAAATELARAEAACHAALGDLVYGADDVPLAQVVGEMLKRESKSVATAESCTGGLLAKYLTDVSGSRDWFRYGWVTYANEAKTSQLGVPEALLAEHGAVSEAVVRAMAEGALARSGADVAVAISGVAGPTGGTPQKPVGTVCLALAAYPAARAEQRGEWTHVTPGKMPPEVIMRTFNFPGDREMIRDRAAKMAMTMLRYHLLGRQMPF